MANNSTVWFGEIDHNITEWDLMQILGDYSKK